MARNKSYYLLRNYLKQTIDLPYKNGTPNITSIAREAGMNDRGPIYKNPDCGDLLKEYTKKLPVRKKAAKGATKQSNKNRELEREKLLAELYTEKCELKRQLRKLQHIERLFQSGKNFLQ